VDADMFQTPHEGGESRPPLCRLINRRSKRDRIDRSPLDPLVALADPGPRVWVGVQRSFPRPQMSAAAAIRAVRLAVIRFE
jgi:hypothetical protein